VARPLPICAVARSSPPARLTDGTRTTTHHPHAGGDVVAQLSSSISYTVPAAGTYYLLVQKTGYNGTRGYR
jgi:hypothetical protein